MASKSANCKNVIIYRNGDHHYPGKRFVVNKSVRDFDAFLNIVSAGVRSQFGAVRRIRTPEHGHPIEHLDDLEHGASYVAAGLEPFTNCNYKTIEPVHHVPVITPRFDWVPPVKHSNRYKGLPGKCRKIKPVPTVISVYTNGDYKKAACRVVISTKEAHSEELILALITDRVKLRTGAVRKLYTVDGKLVDVPKQLSSGAFYVAVGSEKFRALPYGEGAHNPPFWKVLPRDAVIKPTLPPLIVQAIQKGTFDEEKGAILEEKEQKESVSKESSTTSLPEITEQVSQKGTE